MIRPDKCEPMDRERFTEAFVAILEATERPLPREVLEAPIHIDNEDGSMTTLHIPRQAFIRKVQQILDEDWRLPEYSEPEKEAQDTP